MVDYILGTTTNPCGCSAGINIIPESRAIAKSAITYCSRHGAADAMYEVAKSLDGFMDDTATVDWHGEGFSQLVELGWQAKAALALADKEASDG